MILRRIGPIVVAVLILVLTPLFPARAQEIASHAPPSTDFHDFFPALGANFTKGLFDSQNLFPILMAGVAISIVYPYDHKITREISPYSDPIGQAGQILGGPVVIGVVAGSLIATPFSKSKKFRAFSFDLTQAFIMNTVVVQGTKYAVGRTRPNGGDNTSFPSGHAADSFMLATLLNHYYGKKIGIPAYALATFVAFSRVEKGKHFATDVIFGSTLGYVIGSSAIRTHHRNAQKRFAWQPMVSPHYIGLTLALNL